MNTHFGKLPTEQTNPKSKQLDQISIEEILVLINREDQSVPRAVFACKKSIAQGVRIIVRSLKSGGRLFFVGAGTSGRLGVIEAAECPPTFNTPPSLIQAVMAGNRKAVFTSQEGAEDRENEGYKIIKKKACSKDVIAGIAASGVTPFVRGALRAAKSKGAKTLLITCNPSPAVKGRIDCLIAPKVGPEVITGSTRLKAGTATKLVLNMLTVTSMVQLGKVYDNWMVDLQPKSIKLHARAIRIIEKLGSVSHSDAKNLFLRSNKRVKPAILMAKMGLDYSTAINKLKAHSGFLKKALSA